MSSASPLTLRHIEILSELPDDALQQLGRQCALRTYSARQRVISWNATDRNVYLIVSGRVRVAIYAESGREVAYRDVGKGKCFGEISAIDGAPRSANVEALDDSVIALMPSTVFLATLERYPAVMHKVTKLLAATVRSLSERLFELSTLGIQNRVHAEILRLAREAGINKGAARIAPSPKHVDIAARISTNREQVTKELSAMAKQGLVAKSAGALVVPDIARLERIVAAGRR